MELSSACIDAIFKQSISINFRRDFISSNHTLLIDIDIDNSQNLLVSVNKKATIEDQWMKIDPAVLSESRASVHYLDLRVIKICVPSRDRMKQLTFIDKSCSLNFQLFNHFFLLYVNFIP